jgi:hypothetical protein
MIGAAQRNSLRPVTEQAPGFPGEGAMTASVLRRRIGVLIAAAALCAAAAGCISDAQAAAPAKTDGKAKLRYYGGPKSPMWRGQ